MPATIAALGPEQRLSTTSRRVLGAGASKLVHETGSRELLPSFGRVFTFGPRTPVLRKPMTDTVVPSSGWRGWQIVTTSGGSGGPASSGTALHDESSDSYGPAARHRSPTQLRLTHGYSRRTRFQCVGQTAGKP